MNGKQANNPLHGVTLELIVTQLVEHYGWSELGKRVNIRCFNSDPSVKSSLKFLRQTPWARAKVEGLYLSMQKGRDVWSRAQAAPSSNPDRDEISGNETGAERTNRNAHANALKT